MIKKQLKFVLMSIVMILIDYSEVEASYPMDKEEEGDYNHDKLKLGFHFICG